MRKVEIITTGGRCYSAKVDDEQVKYLMHYAINKEPSKYLEIRDITDNAYIAVRECDVESIVVMEGE